LRRSRRPDPAATHLSPLSELMRPLPVHASEATPAGRCARSGKRDAASRRSSFISRRLWGAHSSVITGSHDHAFDATVGTVANQQSDALQKTSCVIHEGPGDVKAVVVRC
jgi:hypothetical protein